MCFLFPLNCSLYSTFYCSLNFQQYRHFRREVFNTFFYIRMIMACMDSDSAIAVHYLEFSRRASAVCPSVASKRTFRSVSQPAVSGGKSSFFLSKIWFHTIASDCDSPFFPNQIVSVRYGWHITSMHLSCCSNVSWFYLNENNSVPLFSLSNSVSMQKWHANKFRRTSRFMPFVSRLS